MKRSLTLPLAVVLSLFAFSAFAAPTAKTTTTKTTKVVSHGKELRGSIKSVDDAAKSFVLDSAGKDNTIYWTSATKVHGGPLKAGENVIARAMEKDAKWIATSVKVMPAKAAAKKS
ncbi:MAG TPA: hypothetical protein VJZ00_25095 [Thermoanaerobaculia bacterium]|nr:hypothetical protein [Thermoanaerobaculia bacterium]